MRQHSQSIVMQSVKAMGNLQCSLMQDFKQHIWQCHCQCALAAELVSALRCYVLLQCVQNSVLLPPGAYFEILQVTYSS